MQWLELQIIVSLASHEAVAEICRQVGCAGVCLQEDCIVTHLPMTDELPTRKAKLLSRLNQLPNWGLPGVQRVSEQVVDDAQWAETWKSFFHVQRVGNRVVVKPSWQDYDPQPEDVIVELDPGMAFGTGQHPTTQLCIEFMENLMQKGMTVVDVGTGSGILAIVAAKLGAYSVWACDNDPVAILTAQRNITHNGVEQCISVHLAEGCDEAPTCDLLVANITAEVVESLLPLFAARLRRGGCVILSGIVQERSNGVRQRLLAAPWVELLERQRGEWCAFAARRA